MNKKFLLIGLLVAFILVFNSVLISAATYSSYNDWYNNYWMKMWKSEAELSNTGNSGYISHLNYNPNDKMDYSRELSELKTESETIKKDPWNYERSATTVVLTTETETEERTPRYDNYNNYGNYNDRYYDYNKDYTDYNTWRNQMYDNYYGSGFNNGKKNNVGNVNCNLCNGVPCTNWRYKTPYSYDKENYNYYPEYDDCLDYYNWRW